MSKRTLGPGSLTISIGGESRDLSVDTTKTAITPSTDSPDPTTYLDGHQESGAQTTTYTLDATVGDDFTMEGFAVWAFKNAGKEGTFEFIPNKDEGKVKWTGKVTPQPIAVGGDVKSNNANDISWPATDVEPVAYAGV